MKSKVEIASFCANVLVMSLTDSTKISPRILSGKVIRDERLGQLSQRFSSIRPTPEMAILQVGNRVDSTAYIKAKTNFAKKVGVLTRHIHLDEIISGGKISQEKIITEIQKCNADHSIKGIIVQLPLPEHIDKEEVINSIDPKKDLDGLTSVNTKLLSENDDRAIIPATARGVMELLNYYKISLKGKRVTVVGRSALVGRPIAQLCMNADAIVSVAHSKTVDLVKETKSADIVIIAVGKKNLITANHVQKGQVIVDVGINRDDQVMILSESKENNIKKIVGDVDFENVSKEIGRTGAITPVPGGVGPMTVLALFENLADICL